VARIWEEEGVPVVSADEIARRVVEPGTPGLQEVTEAFGGEVLRGDGHLDRDALRERIFSDPGARERLEALLHPRIRAFRDRWLAERRREGAELAVAEIPLLFEAGLEGEFDVTVAVLAAREERLRRLAEERGMGEEEGAAIMDAQLDPEAQRRRADFVIENDGSLEELARRAREILDELRSRGDG